MCRSNNGVVKGELSLITACRERMENDWPCLAFSAVADPCSRFLDFFLGECTNLDKTYSRIVNLPMVMFFEWVVWV